MIAFSQGDIIKIAGFKNYFLVISKNAFIRTTKVFHVCPMIKGIPSGPLHIPVTGRLNTEGIVVCEQVKLIDPSARSCSNVDSIPYDSIMNVSDALQGIFECD